MSVSGPTDENVPVPGSAVPHDDGDGDEPDRDDTRSSGDDTPAREPIPLPPGAAVRSGPPVPGGAAAGEVGEAGQVGQVGDAVPAEGQDAPAEQRTTYDRDTVASGLAGTDTEDGTEATDPIGAGPSAFGFGSGGPAAAYEPAQAPHGAAQAPHGAAQAPHGAAQAPHGGGQDDGLGPRSCAYCGRPVPQHGDSSPAVRYCPDNEGACAAAAAERRRRDQDSPGLAGQVARTWDMVERLEDVAELLAISLTGGLSVAGVERRLAEARAEAAAGFALAQREREAARREAEQGLAQLGDVRDEARRVEAEAVELAARLETARIERDAARDMGAQATRTAEAANTAIAAVREENDRLSRRVEELTAALEAARAELARRHEQLAEAKEAQKRSLALEETRTRLRATESELDRMRTTAEVAQKARAAAEQACAEADRQALEARSHAEEMNGERDEIIAERDSLATDLRSCREELSTAEPRLAEHERLTADLERSRQELEQQQSRLLEQQLHSREHSQMVDQLRGALATIISERDSAKLEVDEARAEIERLIQLGPQSARHARPPAFGAPPVDQVPESIQPPRETPPGQFPPGEFPPPPFPASPPGHDLGGPPDSFRRRFLPPPEE